MNAPTIVKVTGIRLRDYLPDNLGSSWDFSSAPDLQVDMNDGSTILFSTSTVWNAPYAFRPFDWTLSSPLTLPSMNRAYTIWLYDDDTDISQGYEDMGFAVVNPNGQSGYPSFIEFDFQGTAFTLYLQWQ